MTIHTDSPPISQWPDGSLRVGKSRLLVDLIVQEFQRGATPEQIVEAYDTASLADVYSIIGYYLRHRSEIEAYLAERERQGEEIKKKIEESQGDSWKDVRARLLARRDAISRKAE
jgi:uncharacterized protein (DUF433 family)